MRNIKIHFKRLFVISSLFLFSLSGMSQVSKSVVNEYPAHIVQRVHEIVVVVPVCEANQMKLGEYFVEQDSLATLALQKSGMSDTLKTYYHISIAELQGIISPLEFNDYKVKMFPRSSSRLRRVVQEYKSLGLTSAQVNALLVTSSYLESCQNRDGYRAMEQCMADSILGHTKYIAYYEIEAGKKADNTVGKWIADLRKANLIVNSIDSVKLHKSLCQFEKRQQANLGYWKDYGDKGRYQNACIQYELQKPKEIKRLDIYKKLPSRSMIREVIQKKDELGLNLDDNILDSLLVKYSVFQQLQAEKKRKKEKFSVRGLECKLIVPLLTVERINKIFVSKCAKQAQEKAAKQMQVLETNGLIIDSNRESVLQELIDYELKSGIAQEWINIERSQENLFRLCDVKDHRPVILQELDKTRKEVKAEKKDEKF